MKRLLRYLLPAVLFATACSKTKTDILPGTRPTDVNLAASTVRLVDGKNYELVMNNTDTLTNWLPGNPYGLPDIPVNPTPWFPGTGKYSGEYFVPRQFLDANGKAIVKIFRDSTLIDSFPVQEDYNHPTDYYLTGIKFNSATGFFIPTVVPRAVTPANDPTQIRIRIVNLANPNGVPTNPAWAVSLAFNDGSLVSPVTSGVKDGTWSDYIELPYGTYGFRVLLDGTPLQSPGAPPLLTSAAGETDYTIAGGQYYIPTKTFQPGGVYSILVSGDARGSYQDNGGSILPVNAFLFITDITAPANLTYARVQGINAAEKNGLHLQIDGADSAIQYSMASGYQTLITGSHAVKVTDGTGKILAQTTLSVKGGDNWSLWVYPTAGGTDSIVTVQNNMGGLRQNGITGDGSDGSNLVYDPLNYRAIVQTRFLNLCPDIPYVTFTSANGTLLPESDFSSALAARNLQAGRPADPMAVPYPYVDLGLGSYGTIEAYQSQPNVLPGNPLTGVPDLTAADFVRLPAFFYSAAPAGMEPGVYTVALIGRSRAGEQPKMSGIKHNL